MSQIKRVMRRAAGGELVRVATFRVENGRIIATYDDVQYGRQLEKDGVALPSGILRPDDGERFYDALDDAYAPSVEMVVTVADEIPPPSEGNFAGYRCPRCAYTGILGRHRTYGERTLEELFCPHCQLGEVADSDQATYAATLARWHPSRA